WAERATSAAVSVLLPWSMWPIVPTLTWGLVRWKTSLAICVVPSGEDAAGRRPAVGSVVRWRLRVHAERRARRGGRVGVGKERCEMELLMGLEPMTSSLPRKCSTTELQQRRVPRARLRTEAAGRWSGRWESNPRVQLGRLTFYH